jgi:hypothetical protein
MEVCAPSANIYTVYAKANVPMQVCVIIALFQVGKSPNLEQSDVQMDSELPTLAADNNHIEQVPGAVPTTNSRGVSKIT